MTIGQRTKTEGAGTAQRILEHARRAFNERGVAAVGMREIARELDLSPGNLSYHFPTKEALVVALVEHVHAENNAAVSTADGPRDFGEVDATIRGVMRRDLENQWLMRDAVGLMISFAALRPLQRRMQHAREARVDSIVERLTAAGLLERKPIERGLPLFREQLLTQVFFWVPASIVAAPSRDPAERLDLHARAAMALFLVYTTPRGRRQLEPLLAPDGASPTRRSASSRPRTSGGARTAITWRTSSR